VNELRIERTNAWLEPHHIKKISDAYWKFKDVADFAKVMSKDAVLENDGNLSLPLYIKPTQTDSQHDVETLLADVRDGQEQINASLETLFEKLGAMGVGAGARLPKS